MSHRSTHYDFLVLSVLVDQIPQCHKLPHSLEKKCSSLFIHDCVPIPVSVILKRTNYHVFQRTAYRVFTGRPFTLKNVSLWYKKRKQ